MTALATQLVEAVTAAEQALSSTPPRTRRRRARGGEALELFQQEVEQTMPEVAAELPPFGIDFQNQARRFETTILKTDQIMRAQLEEERKSIGSVEEFTAPLSTTEGILNDFSCRCGRWEAMSAPPRNSIQGFRDGVRAVNSALGMMRSWVATTD
ncbi:hypothetical protein [Amycolatopsis rubida]|nr:hypothetical protein [Amycolatopsis rubida]